MDYVELHDGSDLRKFPLQHPGCHAYAIASDILMRVDVNLIPFGHEQRMDVRCSERRIRCRQLVGMSGLSRGNFQRQQRNRIRRPLMRRTR